MRLVLVPLAVTLAVMSCGSSHAAEYFQLIATRYPAGATLPADFSRPAHSYDFVAKDKLPSGAKILSAAKAAGGAVWVLTDKGPFRSGEGNGDYVPLEVGPRVLEPGQPNVDTFTRINHIVGDSLGHIWLATTRGVYISDGKQWWQPLNGRDGVPIESVHCLHLVPNGDVWAGTDEGAWRLRNGQFRYFWGKRWMPGNRVKEIWSEPGGKVWIDTDAGLGRIEEVSMTLAKKAEHYDKIAWERHNRGGFINAIDLKVPGDPTQGYTFDVSDNDGLWNAIYIGAQAFRFAATKDPVAREHARVTFNALLDLERKSGIPGFPARAMATVEEVEGGIHGVHLDSKVNAPGVDVNVWYHPKTDPNLWCKGDTSSDELDGHYFAWYVYHDLVADETEKQEIAAVVRRVTDHILRHNLTLVDHTGVKTRWGVWSPELINLDPFYYDLRPLNSLEILCFLKVAAHITGDSKYTDVYNDLITKHHYLINSLMMRRGGAGQWPNINHSDDELLYLVYYPLLMLEKDPAHRRFLTQSIARTWEYSADDEQPIRPEHSPFYNFIYGATTGRRCDVEEAVETLQDWPWELIGWTTHNSQRNDVKTQSMPESRRSRIKLDRVLPASERSQGRWNSNPWIADGGGDGRTEHDGAAWAIGYWLGVHHGYISVKD